MKNITFPLSIFIIATLFGCGEKKSGNTEVAGEKQIAATNKIAGPVIIQQQSEPDTLKGSPEAEATGTIGDTEFRISYHSPAVRGRIIWGGLVAFDKVWVTGAHMATVVEFNHDILIGNKSIPSGKYALFTIPGKERWTVILNKNWQQHLSDEYDEKEDVSRLQTEPETETTNQERLRYVIEKETETEGEIVVYWEKLEVSLPFKLAGRSK